MEMKELIAIGIAAGLLLAPPAVLSQKNEVAFQLQDNLIRVPVLINGNRADGVLDSGAGAFVLDRSFALRLGLQLGAESGKVPGGGGAIPMFPVQIAKVELGPEQLSQLPAIVLDTGHLSSSAGFKIEVLLGQAVFLKQPIRISYPDRMISFLQPGEKTACAEPIPFELIGGTPVVSVDLQATTMSASRTLHLVVDLGTRHYAAMLGKAFLDSPDGKLLENSGKLTQVGTGTGGAVMGSVVRLANLKVGQYEFKNVEVALTSQVGAFSNGGIDGSLGVPLWQSGTITFDYPQHSVCIQLPTGSAN